MCRFDRYPKTKRKGKFELDVKQFIEKSEKLFDIFCYDDILRKNQEHIYKLRMTKEDYQFLEDQKTYRIGRCLNIEERLTQSDLTYRRRIENFADAEQRYSSY